MTDPQRAANAFDAALESSIATRDFNKIMVDLVLKNPYFFPPYIELMDFLEARGGKEYEYRELLRLATDRLRSLLSDSHLPEIVSEWTERERLAALEILSRTTMCGSLKEKVAAALLKAALRIRIRAAPAIRRAPHNLVLLERGTDVERIGREIEANEICWLYEMARQDTITVQQHTNAIALRRLKARSSDFVAADGPHESVRTPFAALFPYTTSVVEDFAIKNNGGLGRVVIVRLRPNSIVYRHYDSEEYLAGRDRYHIVVKSPRGSLMTSGVEERRFFEGDLFFFENKKMHTAINESREWRIHIIFDMTSDAAARRNLFALAR